MSPNQPDSGQEQIEGLGEVQGEFWRDYPIDDLLIRHESRTVHEVLRRITLGRFVMNPDFQRDFVWDDSKQSKLIESIIMRIPLPVLYLAEDEEGRMIVVDGLQRLSTFKRFVDNHLQLKLPDRPNLHGKRFKDLAPKLQNRVEDCNLILYVIDQKVPEQARLDIFDRVNSGVPLTRQQMRNSLYTGEATRFLKTEASTELFLEATGRSPEGANNAGPRIRQPILCLQNPGSGRVPGHGSVSCSRAPEDEQGITTAGAVVAGFSEQSQQQPSSVRQACIQKARAQSGQPISTQCLALGCDVDRFFALR